MKTASQSLVIRTPWRFSWKPFRLCGTAA